MTLGGAVLPAVANETPDTLISIDSAANKYERAAAYIDSSVSEVKELEATGAVKVTDNGFVLNIDGVVAAEGSLSSLDLPAAPAGAAIPGDATNGSRPGAPVTVYLDFNGQTLQNTQWNDLTSTPTLNFAPANVGNDASFVAEVWAAVAEDYAPFNVNVTTTDPGTDALVKASFDDNQYGSHVIITDSYDETVPDAAGTSGLAFVGGTGSDYSIGALVFTEGAGGANVTSAALAGVASHESGHNFGLLHDGIDGSTTGPYYYPTDGLWGPIMGSTYDVPVSQWSNGGYAGATELQDDLAVITDRSSSKAAVVSFTTPDGQPYTGPFCELGDADYDNPKPGDVFYVANGNVCDRTGATLTARLTYMDRADYAADQVADSAAEATALDNSAGTFGTAGVIETTGDLDVYSVITAGGDFTASVEVANILPNLDTKLTLTDTNGNVIAEDAPESTRVSAVEAEGLGATVTATLAAGIYYLTVDGVGTGDPTLATPVNSNGYTDYASLGNFVVSGAADPLITEPLVIVTPVDGATVVGGADVEITGTATPDATLTLTVGGAAVATATADEDGNWTSSVKANQYGKTSVVVSQQVATIQITGTATVTVAAPVDAPVIVSPVTGTTTDDSTPAISGTGIPNAKVSVTVTSTAGGFAGEAVVTAEGKWEIVTNELPVGAYTVTANQSINEGTSAGEKINFTVVARVAPPVTDPPVTTTPTTNTNSLASTGVADSAPLALMGLLLMLAGAGAVVFRLRKKQSVES
ncbi:MAG: Ig-like domain-containing protein [Rhodoglobus sp.]